MDEAGLPFIVTRIEVTGIKAETESHETYDTLFACKKHLLAGKGAAYWILGHVYRGYSILISRQCGKSATSSTSME